VELLKVELLKVELLKVDVLKMELLKMGPAQCGSRLCRRSRGSGPTQGRHPIAAEAAPTTARFVAIEVE
jgi:hypothetical protein